MHLIEVPLALILLCLPNMHLIDLEVELYQFCLGFLDAVPETGSSLDCCSLSELLHYKTDKMTCAPSEDADQPGHRPV